MAQLDDVEQLARHEQKFGEGKRAENTLCRLRKMLYRIILMKEKFLFSGHHQPLASHDRLSLFVKNN
jgi:hypothetical protein